VRARVLAVALGLGGVGCVSVPHPTEASASRIRAVWPHATVTSLEAGRTLLLHHCASCHALQTPDHRTGDEWRAALDRMAREANLSAANAELVLAFLTSAAKRDPRVP